MTIEYFKDNDEPDTFNKNNYKFKNDLLLAFLIINLVPLFLASGFVLTLWFPPSAYIFTHIVTFLRGGDGQDPEFYWMVCLLMLAPFIIIFLRYLEKSTENKKIDLYLPISGAIYTILVPVYLWTKTQTNATVVTIFIILCLGAVAFWVLYGLLQQEEKPTTIAPTTIAPTTIAQAQTDHETCQVIKGALSNEKLKELCVEGSSFSKMCPIACRGA